MVLPTCSLGEVSQEDQKSKVSLSTLVSLRLAYATQDLLKNNQQQQKDGEGDFIHIV